MRISAPVPRSPSGGQASQSRAEAVATPQARSRRPRATARAKASQRDAMWSIVGASRPPASGSTNSSPGESASGWGPAGGGRAGPPWPRAGAHVTPPARHADAPDAGSCRDWTALDEAGKQANQWGSAVPAWPRRAPSARDVCRSKPAHAIVLQLPWISTFGLTKHGVTRPSGQFRRATYKNRISDQRENCVRGRDARSGGDCGAGTGGAGHAGRADGQPVRARASL